MLRRFFSLALCLACLGLAAAAQTPEPTPTTTPPAQRAQAAPAEEVQYEYRMLATNRTSTMEKEMKEAADAGYRFEKAISGPTAFGGDEAMVIMSRPRDGEHKARYEYKLLATTKTSTMQKELQEAGDAGFEHRDETVFKKTFSTEVMVILERDREAKPKLWEYKLLATKKTSTMQKEILEAAAAGYQFVGVSVGSTFFGGSEVVTIMRRPRKE
ncbi:MAG TPA: hypothetical protein VGX48_02880 [Pyrinomonadaceae bacterium]|jgi:hypothetical protein|nr:hypothetical protein [Pyrinomonadaceae bacterium]